MNENKTKTKTVPPTCKLDYRAALLRPKLVSSVPLSRRNSLRPSGTRYSDMLMAVFAVVVDHTATLTQLKQRRDTDHHHHRQGHRFSQSVPGPFNGYEENHEDAFEEDDNNFDYDDEHGDFDYGNEELDSESDLED
jgi:hypothetical protein